MSAIALSFFFTGLFLELHASYVDVFGFAPSNYFFLIAFALQFKDALKYLASRKFIQVYFLIFILGACSFLLADYFNGIQSHYRYVIKGLAKMPLLFLLTCYFVEKKGLPSICRVFFILMLPSILVAIGQFAQIEFFWQLRRFIEPISFEVDFNANRTTGLAQYFVDFALKAYVALFCAVVASDWKNKWPYIVIGVIFFALLTSLTRSYIYAAVISVSLMGFLNYWHFKMRPHANLVFICLSLLIVFQAYSWQKSQNLDPVQAEQINRLVGSDISIGARVYMAIGAIHLWQTHPILGIGSKFMEYRKTLGAQVNLPHFDNIPGRDLAYSHNSHNSFLNFLLTQGVFAFLVLIVFLGWILTCLYRQKTVQDHVLVFALLGLLLNAIFHNSSLWDSTAGTFLLAISANEASKAKGKFLSGAKLS